MSVRDIVDLIARKMRLNFDLFMEMKVRLSALSLLRRFYLGSMFNVSALRNENVQQECFSKKCVIEKYINTSSNPSFQTHDQSAELDGSSFACDFLPLLNNKTVVNTTLETSVYHGNMHTTQLYLLEDVKPLEPCREHEVYQHRKLHGRRTLNARQRVNSRRCLSL